MHSMSRMKKENQTCCSSSLVSQSKHSGSPVLPVSSCRTQYRVLVAELNFDKTELALTEQSQTRITVSLLRIIGNKRV